MNRDLTNRIRFVLDECIPPIIRDSRWFMWPWFVLAYGRLNVRDMMDFKSRAWHMSPDDYEAFYAGLNGSVSRRRATDLNRACLDFIEGWVRSQATLCTSLLDVGAGSGFLLGHVARQAPGWVLEGVDARVPEPAPDHYVARRALLPNLPYPNDAFDLVTCTHVLEHVPDLKACVDELLRVTRQRLLIVVPRQRYYRYTLDEHLNFFPQIEPLMALFAPRSVEVHLLDGDWLMLIDCRTEFDGSPAA